MKRIDGQRRMNYKAAANNKGFVWLRDETQHEALLHEIPTRMLILNRVLWGFNFTS